MLPPCGERFYYSRWIVSTRSHTRTKTTRVLSTTSIYWSDLNQIHMRRGDCLQMAIWPSLDLYRPLSPSCLVSLVQLSSKSAPQQLLKIPTHTRSRNKKQHTRRQGYDGADFSLFQSFVNCDGLVHGVGEDRDTFPWRRLLVCPCARPARVPLYIPFSGRAKVRLRCGSAQSNIIPFFWAPPDVSPLDPWLPRTPSESFGEPTLTSHVGVHLPLSRSTRPAPRCWLIQGDYSPKSVVWVD